MTQRRLDRSVSAARGWSITILIIVGTMNSALTPYFGTCSRNSSTSNPDGEWMTWLQPFIVNTRALWPDPWVSGAACMPTSSTSSRIESASAASDSKTSTSWVSIAPLGRPVVPEV